MSKIMKTIVPLLDENLTRKDLSKKAGFCGAFVKDKNRPGLDNHIFLMYDISNPTEENHKREARFRKQTNIYSEKVVFIKGIPYKIYAYPRLNSDINYTLKHKLGPKYIKNTLRVMKFWNFTDEELDRFLLSDRLSKLEYKCKTIPEADYMHEFELGI